MSEIYLPVGGPIVDKGSGRATDPMIGWMRQITRAVPSTGGAPADAEYLVGALDADLTAERLATTSADITVNLAIPGQVTWTLTDTARILRRTTTTVTDAQIKALPTTDVTIIAGQGTGTRIVFLRADCLLNTAAGAYTNLSPDAYLFASGGFVESNYLANDSTIPITYLSDVFGVATTWNFGLDLGTLAEPVNQWGNLVLAQDVSGGITNQPWVLQLNNAAAGNLTGGNAANSLIVNAYYAVIS